MLYRFARGPSAWTAMAGSARFGSPPENPGGVTCLASNLQVRVVNDEAGRIVVEGQRLSFCHSRLNLCHPRLSQCPAPRSHAKHEREEKSEKKTAQRFQLITQSVRLPSRAIDQTKATLEAASRRKGTRNLVGIYHTKYAFGYLRTFFQFAVTWQLSHCPPNEPLCTSSLIWQLTHALLVFSEPDFVSL